MERIVDTFREVAAVVRAARFLTFDRSEEDGFSVDKHVAESTGEDQVSVGVIACVGEFDVLVLFLHFLESFVTLEHTLFVFNDCAGSGHFVAESSVDFVWVELAVHVDELIDLGLFLVKILGVELFRFVGSLVFDTLDVVSYGRTAEEAVENAGEQGVSTEAGRTVILVVDFTESVDAFDVCHHVFRIAVLHAVDSVKLVAWNWLAFFKFVLGVEATHAVVDSREDLHWYEARVVASELLVDFENRSELVLGFDRKVGDVEVSHAAAADAVAIFAYGEDFACSDVTRNEVAVFRVTFFEEVPAFFFRDVSRLASVTLLARDPDATTFATSGLGHEAALIFTWDSGWVNLNHFSVADFDASFVAASSGSTGADDGHGGLAVDDTATAGCHDDCVSAERFEFHCALVLSDDALTCAVFVEDWPKEFPELVVVNFALRFVATSLFVESVEELLTCGCASEVSTFEE